MNMEDDQVEVLLQLNLNESREGKSKEDNSSSQDVFSAQNIAMAESRESSEQDHNFNRINNTIERDVEFIKKHAADADRDFLHSLLDSQIDNPKRLESIMLDMLNIPNALELIEEFRGSRVRTGEKRSISDTSSETEDIKKKRTNETISYLQQIQDMFPDADGLFLISECQQLESWEDCSRFINTVMISGLYPKKGAIQFSPVRRPTRVIDIVNDKEYRPVEIISSEEEISSSGMSASPKRRRRRTRRRNPSSRSHSEAHDNSFSSVIEIVDIASDCSNSPDFGTTRQLFDSSVVNDAMEVEEEIPAQSQAWETNLVDDIENLLHKKFGADTREEENNSSVPEAGPSGLGNRPRLSLPGRASASPERSLAEIIETKRNDRRRSLDSRTPKPSTSKASERHLQLMEEAFPLQVSSPKVSTTSESSEKTYMEIETAVTGEKEEAPKVSEKWVDEQTANLIQMFPNTDPSYLREVVEKMNGSSEEVNEFVNSKMEKNDMPTRAEYEKKKEMEELQNRYTSNFSIEDFLKAIPDPWTYFTQGNRKCIKYKNHSLCYLRSAFRKHYVRDIIDTFRANKCNLYLSYCDLKKECAKKRGSRRSDFECNSNRPTTINIQFLQEVAFIENEERIKDYMEGEKIARRIKFDEAKRTGSLLECQCCFDSEVMVEDIVYCPKDHTFCRDCVIKSVEVEMGNGKCQFECLASCEEKFTLSCLQNVLKPELFSKVIQANQMEEIRAAGIEDLVQCPFCNYATIMPPEEKVMTCLNPECLKESCRLCKELNHIPLRCDEVEKSEEVKMRTYIENKMTEALVRTCYKCGKKFVKEDGCNKMTCTCGAKMCYVCRKPVTTYSHFNGQGGTEYHKCPLYSHNDELHVDLVRRVGEEAKAEILQANPSTKLLYDPTVIMPEKTGRKTLPGTNNGAALALGLLAIRENLNQEEEKEDDNAEDGHDPRRDHPRRDNMHSRHRHRVEIESDDDSEEDPGHFHLRYNHRYRHYYLHCHHRLGHQQVHDHHHDRCHRHNHLPL